MGKARKFSTVSIGAMLDRELTGLEWRLYAWVSLHDGMSLLKGKGAGCYAANLTLFQEAGCDYSSGCRALSKLVKRGHLIREQVGRSTRYRVTFPDPDNLRACNISTPQHVAGLQEEPPGYVAEANGHVPDIPRGTGSDYSSLSEELDSVETEELNSSKRRDFGFSELDGGEPLAIQWALQPHLPRNFTTLPPGAQLQRFEDAFARIGRNPDRMHSRERQAFAEFLHGIGEEFAAENDAISNHAMRLWGEVASF